MNDKRLALYGHYLNGVSAAVLTPITALFDGFEGREHRGWWRTKINGEVAVVKCPAGTHAADTAFYLPEIKRLAFTGYCGACGNHLPGDVVSASYAVNGVDEIAARVDFEGIESGRVLQVATLHEQEHPSFAGKLCSSGASFVDMETYSIFKATKAQEFGAIYVVTDNLFRRPFHEVDGKDLARISNAYARVGSALEAALEVKLWNE